jgi:hypothetical protein
MLVSNIQDASIADMRPERCAGSCQSARKFWNPFAGVNLPRRINGYSEFPLLKVFNGAILARNRPSLANIG